MRGVFSPVLRCEACLHRLLHLPQLMLVEYWYLAEHPLQDCLCHPIRGLALGQDCRCTRRIVLGLRFNSQSQTDTVQQRGQARQLRIALARKDAVQVLPIKLSIPGYLSDASCIHDISERQQENLLIAVL